MLQVNGAHWDVEMGALTHMLTEKSSGTAPAILFDDIPGYPKGTPRPLWALLVHPPRRPHARPSAQAGSQGGYRAALPQAHAGPQTAPAPLRQGHPALPILQNVLQGDAVDVLKFPVPRHHELDKARFIGTADCVMTQDPDAGWFNLGAYRSQVYDGKTVGCQITEGKHGRIHRDKYFERGEPMKVVILCGQDPLLFMLASSPLPEISELDIAGGLRGEPIDVVRGPFTGFPIPADCEIALEGETVPGQVRPEGPFGEWMGYYSDDTVPRPYVNIKTILYRNDPILCCAPQHKPVDETGLLKGIAGAAQISRALDACGVPEVLGVWNHEAGPATRFTVIQIHQRYPGHARQALQWRRPARAAPMRANGRWWWTRTSTPASSIRCCGRCARGSIPRTTSISSRRRGRPSAIRCSCPATSTIASWSTPASPTTRSSPAPSRWLWMSARSARQAQGQVPAYFRDHVSGFGRIQLFPPSDGVPASGHAIVGVVPAKAAKRPQSRTHTNRAFTPVFDGLWQPIERTPRMGPCFRRDDSCHAFGQRIY